MSKTIVLTGAGGVLCSRLAEALAENGHKIAVLDLRMEAADSVVARIKANGGTAIGVEANVLEKDNLIRAKKKVNNILNNIFSLWYNNKIYNLFKMEKYKLIIFNYNTYVV